MKRSAPRYRAFVRVLELKDAGGVTMPDKVMVTNQSALSAKYGTAAWRTIKKALSALTAADKRRGLSARLIALDHAPTMKKLHGKPVTSVANCRQNKEAIDAVWKSLGPDYLVIVGASDIVPHQDLRNPAFAAGDDDDQVAFGDLPYACDTPYSRDVETFVGPTRVVSRIPDMAGAKTPDHLLRLLGLATRWKSRPASDYDAYFGLTAAVWSASTELSLTNVFGSTDALKKSPKAGPTFGKRDFGARMHFINCHGGDADPQFYGQRGEDEFPVALTSGTTARKVSEGTVAAVECCYGGQLYPAEILKLPIPICQSYLTQGAYGYFGSTTIAYGPSEGNGAADIITQQFLLEVLQGASIGRAALAARQAFVSQTGQMDAVDLKTLAQFCLYGDASIQPIDVTTPTTTPRGVAVDLARRVSRQERRKKMTATGRDLLGQKPTAGRAAIHARVSPRIRKVLDGLASQVAGKRGEFVSYPVKQKGTARGAKATVRADRYHVLVKQLPDGRAPQLARKVAIVAKEAGNRIVGYRVYYSR